MLNAAPTANEQYVTGLFNQLLNRAPTSSELSSYSTQLDAGVAARVPVALEIMNTPDFNTAAVENAFSSLLHRQPEAAAITGFSNILAQGGTLADMDALIAGSAEYYQTRGNGTTQGFLDAVYQDALARAPDAEGLASFTAALNSGTSRYEIASFIFNNSSEFKFDWISGLYGRFADRAPTSAELQSSLTTLHYQGEKAVIAGIVSTGSAYGVLSDHANGLYVTEMFRDLLRRDPDSASLTAWEAALDNGTSTPAQVANGILSSPEYEGDVVDAIYQQYLGRAADTAGRAAFIGILASGGTPEQVAADVASSPEFIQLHTDGTQQGFLNQFYQDTFDSPLSSAGSSFASSLNLALSPQELAQSVLESPAYRTRLVQSLDGALLGRGASGTDIAAGSAILAGNRGDLSLIGSIVTSPEYADLSPTAAAAPGTLTFDLLGATRSTIHGLILEAQAVGAASNGTVTVAPFIDSMQALSQDISTLQQIILPLLSKQTESVTIGTSAQGPVVLKSMDLTVSDKIALNIVDGNVLTDALNQIENKITNVIQKYKTPVAVGVGVIATVVTGDPLVGIAAGGAVYGSISALQYGVPAIVAPKLNELINGTDNPATTTTTTNSLSELNSTESTTADRDLSSFTSTSPFANVATDTVNQSDAVAGDVQGISYAYNENAQTVAQNLPNEPLKDTAPAIGLPQPNIDVDVTEGASNPESEELTVENDTDDGSTLDATVTPYDPQVIHVAQQSTGSVASDATSTINVSIDTQGLQPGVYDSGILVADPNASDGEEFVPVDITVNPPENIPPQVGGEFGGGQSQQTQPPSPGKNLGNFEGQFDLQQPFPSAGTTVDENVTVSQVTLSLASDGTLTGQNLTGMIEQFDPVTGNPAGYIPATGSITATVSGTPDAAGYTVHGTVTLNTSQGNVSVPFSANLASANQRLSGVTVDSNGQPIGNFALHSI